MEKSSGKSFNSEIYIKAGGQFPFRRYIHGMSNVISKLRFLINEYEPLYNPDGFNKSALDGKIKSIMFPEDGTVFDYFEKGPKNVKQDSNWDYDEVIDFYTESARMSSPGYGKTYTPLDLWFDKSLADTLAFRIKGHRTLKEVREGIHKDGEVRLAYVTDSIGLYKYIKEELLNLGSSKGTSDSGSPIVVDISAFGDRLVAAAATGYRYIGVDPDPNLVEGISRLSSDIKAIKPNFEYNMYTLPFEHFVPSHEVDLITLSPPPFLAEPYTGGERQVHKVYPDFKNWFYGFIRDTLTRSFTFLREGGVLAFTILDRSGRPNSSQYQIYYTEAMILYAMYMGFRPVEIFTLSSDSGTPWWIFRKDSSYVGNNLFLKYYPDYIISDYFTSKTPSIEFIRYLAFGYISNICQDANLFKDSSESNVKKILGRILMSKSPSEIDSDPVYPDNYSNVIILEDDFNSVSEVNFPIIIQTSDSGYRMGIIDKSKYSDSREILADIFHMVNYYLQWIQCTTEYHQFSKSLRVVEKNGYVNLTIDKRFELASISFLRRYTLFSYDRLERIRVLPHLTVLWSSKDRGINKNNMNGYLRYETVGAPMHHFTRPTSRIEALAKIAKLKTKDQIVDLFATMSNANSKLYTSVYPDVDTGSLGNFFTYDGGDHHVFMVNPPPYNGFNEKMVDRLVNVHLLGDPKNIVFYSTTVYEADAMDYLDRIRKGEDPNFNDFDGYYVLSYLWTYYRNYIRAVYILDHNLHPSEDPTTGKTYGKRRPTESVGVILAEESVDLDLGYLTLLSGGAHVEFEIE